MKQIHQAFTLVELIVVVTILAILATIGFVSYSGYLTGVRDTNRVASLTAISDGLELYRTKNDLPLPDNSVEVQVESEIIARQGYAGSNVLQTIEYSKAGKDPKDDQYYSYYLTDDKKHYQMMAFLEESDNLETKLKSHPNPLLRGEGIAQKGKLFSSLTKGEMSEGQRGLLLGINSAFAATDYSNRHPKVYGKRLGILTDSDNTPIQEISTIKTAGNLNMTGGLVEEFIAHLQDNKKISGSGSELKKVEIFLKSGGNPKKVFGEPKNCRDIQIYGNNIGDGVYTAEINNNMVSVYCDMTTAGGGWTLLYNRRESIGGQDFVNTEACGNNTNEFLNGTFCGDVTNISRTDSYSIGGEIKDYLFQQQLEKHQQIEVFIQQLDNNIDDTNDNYIITSQSDIFPNNIGTMNNIPVIQVCNLVGICDTTDAFWKYVGNGYYSNAHCSFPFVTGGNFQGTYGYCENGVSTQYNASSNLGGDRGGYNQLKLWGHGSTAKGYQERIYFR